MNNYKSTYETQVYRGTKVEKGKSFIKAHSAQLNEKAHLDHFHYCSFHIDLSDGKEEAILGSDRAIEMKEVVLAKLEKLFRSSSNTSVDRSEYLDLSQNECKVETAEEGWYTYMKPHLERPLIASPQALSLKLIGRTTTYETRDLTFEFGMTIETGDIEYFISSRLVAVLYQGKKEIYRGNAMFKDYKLLPEEEPFEYNLSQENIEKLTSLALEDYFNYIKTN